MPSRSLPSRRNRMLDEENTPSYEILVERRCLGQTELRVKPAQVGNSNATKPDNLGWLDYAHLRVPLPKDLSGSGIFHKQGNRKYPESYFMMRRSNDGFVSGTGLFKAAFPWAQQAEYDEEKDHMKTLSGTPDEEVAGNVWLRPDQALELSREYGMEVWLKALLDPEPIAHGTNNPSKHITSPPTYHFHDAVNGGVEAAKPKAAGKKSVRGARSESPSKKTPARKMATPRKPRKGRKADAADDAAPPEESANGENAPAIPAPLPPSDGVDDDQVKISIKQVKEPTITGLNQYDVLTDVQIEMPPGREGLEEPANAEKMVADARKIVKTLEGETESKGRNKRKAEDMETADEAGTGADAAGPASKKQKTTQLELRKERIKRRTVTGIVATLALGALVPAMTVAFGAS